MKKILLVANVAKEHVLKFHIPTIKALKNAGWKVDVACSGEESVPFCDKQYHAAWKRSPFSLKNLKGYRELSSVVQNEHYDIIYCHTPVGGLMARLAARRARKKGTRVIYFAHGFHFFRGAPLLNWIIYFPIEWILAHFTDEIWTNNDEDYQNTKRFFPFVKNVRHFPGIGVDFNRLNIANKEQVKEQYRTELDIPKDAVVLIYVAELIPNKNQGMLLRVLSSLLSTGGSYYLLLVGPDHNDGRFQQLAKKMQVDQNVRFLGWRQDIGELMIASDIGLASSIREGFGINVIESLYCGLPVIATNNRGHSMIIRDGENGFLVPVDDDRLMTEKIRLILEDSALRKVLSNIDVSTYECNLIAQQIVDAVQSLEGI